MWCASSVCARRCFLVWRVARIVCVMPMPALALLVLWRGSVGIVVAIFVGVVLLLWLLAMLLALFVGR